MGNGNTARSRPTVNRWPVVVTLGLIALLFATALLLVIQTLAARPAAAQTTPAPAAGPASATIVPEGLVPATPWLRPDPTRALSRIGFGSCLDQAKPQPIWDAVIASKPDLFLMLGDNVYGDVVSIDRRELIAAYRQQAAQPELARARAAMPFLATWDDHDFGFNDAGRHFAHKRETAELFRAFWRQPEARGHGEGVYYATIIGPEGRRVQIIMLDTRTFRSDLQPRAPDFPHWGRYEPTSDPDATLLGPEQWAWLEAELKKPAEIRLLVSSIQVIAEGHGFERWGNMPAERARLETLLESTGAKGVVILSGDRHAAAIYRQERPGRLPLVEITSSSLNRPYGPSRDTRMPPLVSPIYHPENFATLDIDWSGAKMRGAIRGQDGREVATIEISFSDLGL